MKVTFTFELDNPEDKQKAKVHYQAIEMYLTLYSIRERLRKAFNDEDLDRTDQPVGNLLSELYHILDDYEVNLNILD